MLVENPAFLGAYRWWQFCCHSTLGPTRDCFTELNFFGKGTLYDLIWRSWSGHRIPRNIRLLFYTMGKLSVIIRDYGKRFGKENT